MDIKTIVAIVVVSVSSMLYQASNWWERAYATHESSSTSPDGCIRIETYRPFWVLPSFLHRLPHPDPEASNNVGMEWEFPIFNRAYEVRTGALLGESIVYDPSSAFDGIDWGNPRTPGRRVVKTNGFPIVDSDHCADKATLAKLDAYYNTGRWTIDPAVEGEPPPETDEQADPPVRLHP